MTSMSRFINSRHNLVELDLIYSDNQCLAFKTFDNECNPLIVIMSIITKKKTTV